MIHKTIIGLTRYSGCSKSESSQPNASIFSITSSPTAVTSRAGESDSDMGPRCLPIVATDARRCLQHICIERKSGYGNHACFAGNYLTLKLWRLNTLAKSPQHRSKYHQITWWASFDISKRPCHVLLDPVDGLS